MGFVREAGNAAFGLTGLALKPFGSSKKKPVAGPTPMLTLSGSQREGGRSSLIGRSLY